MADMALAALIDGVEARNDWTDTRVVQQAKTRGHKLTTSDVSDYRHRGMKQIVPAKIRALAAGLELPPVPSGTRGAHRPRRRDTDGHPQPRAGDRARRDADRVRSAFPAGDTAAGAKR